MAGRWRVLVGGLLVAVGLLVPGRAIGSAEVEPAPVDPVGTVDEPVRAFERDCEDQDGLATADRCVPGTSGPEPAEKGGRPVAEPAPADPTPGGGAVAPPPELDEAPADTPQGWPTADEASDSSGSPEVVAEQSPDLVGDAPAASARAVGASPGSASITAPIAAPAPAGSTAPARRAAVAPAPVAEVGRVDAGASAVQQIVTPGAFCATTMAGQSGVSATGVDLVCSRTETDSRLRWRRADADDLITSPGQTTPPTTAPPTTAPATTAPPPPPPPAPPVAPQPPPAEVRGSVGAPGTQGPSGPMARTGVESTAVAAFGTSMLLLGVVLLAGSRMTLPLGPRRGGFTVVLIDSNGRTHERHVVSDRSR